MRLLLLILITVSLTACSSAKSLFGIAPTIETIFTPIVAGTYTVQVYKDGHVLYAKKYECTTNEEGKLTGCHERPATP